MLGELLLLLKAEGLVALVHFHERRNLNHTNHRAQWIWGAPRRARRGQVPACPRPFAAGAARQSLERLLAGKAHGQRQWHPARNKLKRRRRARREKWLHHLPLTMQEGNFDFVYKRTSSRVWRPHQRAQVCDTRDKLDTVGLMVHDTAITVKERMLFCFFLPYEFAFSSKMLYFTITRKINN